MRGLRLTPRWYQTECVDSLWQYLEETSGNPVLALPTGTGKSLVIAMIIQRALTEYPGTRIIKLTHVKELIEQNMRQLTSLWPQAPAGIYSAGLNRREANFPVTFAGIASVAKKPELFGKVDLVIVDECHTVGLKESSNYQAFFRGLMRYNPDLRVIGLSATPYRLGQGLVTDGGLFTDVCYDLTSYDNFNRLITEGWLCPLIPKRTRDEIDVTGVRTSNGDYNLSDLQAVVDREEVTRQALEELIEQGVDRKHWLIFAAGIIHADHVADKLNELGIPTVSIHSKMSDDARALALRGWKQGTYRCAVNNNVLTTGFDFPALDLIAVLRPTKSPGLWVQMLGRGTRPSPGKSNCLVLDFAGNTRRLGPINDPVIPRKKTGSGGGGAPIKLCPACNAYNHTSVRFCAACGNEFIAKVKIAAEASELELISGTEPIVEDFAVDSIEYQKYKPRVPGKPPSLRVTYVCGLRRFSEWVCLEHESQKGGHRARRWWRLRSPEAPPETVDEALQRINELAVARHVRVWLNTKSKYPEIMKYDFVGSGFDD